MADLTIVGERGLTVPDPAPKTPLRLPPRASGGRKMEKNGYVFMINARSGATEQMIVDTTWLYLTAAYVVRNGIRVKHRVARPDYGPHPGHNETRVNIWGDIQVKTYMGLMKGSINICNEFTTLYDLTNLLYALAGGVTTILSSQDDISQLMPFDEEDYPQ